MSTPITLYRRIAGVLTNATTVTLADSTSTFGILRLDNQSVTVSSGTATTNPATGIYQYDISGLDPRYTYIASWKIVSSYGTEYFSEIINPPGVVNTRGQVRAAAARLMGLLIAEGTTTSASGGISIVDGSLSNGGLISDSDSIYRFDGCFLLFTTGPASGYWREISAGKYVPATGTLQFATAFSPTPTAAGGDKYEIYAGLTPDQWSLRDNNSIVDNALTRCRFRRRSPITLITDGDMESNGVANWTPTTCSVAKTAIDSVTFGAQSLLQVNSSASGYIQSSSVNVIPTHGYVSMVDYRCVGANKSTATMQIWDVTNNVLIQAGTDADNGINFEGGRIFNSFTVPTGCYQIAMRLIGTESNAVIAWDDAILFTAGRRRYQTPSWILNRNQIMNYLVRTGNRPYEDTWQTIGWPTDIQEDPTAFNTFVVDIPSVSNSLPIYVDGQGAYGPMLGTSDALPTSCPLEWAKFSAAREAWQTYSRAIEGASMARAVMDRAAIELLATQKDRMYMPVYESSMGLTKGMAGLEITPRMLG